MFTSRSLRKAQVLTKRASRRTMRYFGKGIMRIFGLSKDQYPKTGVQPFSGDPAKEQF